MRFLMGATSAAMFLFAVSALASETTEVFEENGVKKKRVEGFGGVIAERYFMPLIND